MRRPQLTSGFPLLPTPQQRCFRPWNVSAHEESRFARLAHEKAARARRLEQLATTTATARPKVGHAARLKAAQAARPKARAGHAAARPLVTPRTSVRQARLQPKAPSVAKRRALYLSRGWLDPVALQGKVVLVDVANCIGVLGRGLTGRLQDLARLAKGQRCDIMAMV